MEGGEEVTRESVDSVVGLVCWCHTYSVYWFLLSVLTAFVDVHVCGPKVYAEHGAKSYNTSTHVHVQAHVWTLTPIHVCLHCTVCSFWLTSGISVIEKKTTPWYCGVFSVIRPSPDFDTWLPYRNDCSALGFSHTLYWGENKNSSEGSECVPSHCQTQQFF